ncbi:hypothetical protein NDU88_004248 [Pleurodeles waltl]|uniref:Uncharacterized protein n=1 Tax=Pleurodeles waltl TaxID=8319 RepID=A0AAV7WVB8_PLEWA|nr:hypothetical protein NDU88_004248 [Pleurodeles waltl]
MIVGVNPARDAWLGFPSNPARLQFSSGAASAFPSKPQRVLSWRALSPTASQPQPQNVAAIPPGHLSGVMSFVLCGQ